MGPTRRALLPKRRFCDLDLKQLVDIEAEWGARLTHAIMVRSYARRETFWRIGLNTLLR
jgi:hypothetical protein